MNQPDLFTAAPVIRSSAPVEMRPRLSRQCQLILDRLTEGPATNRELSQIALKYTGRISELKQAGYKVACYDQNRVTGFSRYRLERNA